MTNLENPYKQIIDNINNINVIKKKLRELPEVGKLDEGKLNALEIQLNNINEKIPTGGESLVSQSEMESLNTQVRELSNTITELDMQLKETRAQNEALQGAVEDNSGKKRLDKVFGEITRLDEEIKRVQAAQDSYNAGIAQLESKNNDLKSLIQDHTSLIKELDKRLGSVEGTITALQSNIDSSIAKAKQEIKNQIPTELLTKDDIDNILQQLDEVSTKNTTLSNKMNQISDEMGKLSTTPPAKTSSTDIESLRVELNKFKDELVGLATTFGELLKTKVDNGEFEEYQKSTNNNIIELHKDFGEMRDNFDEYVRLQQEKLQAFESALLKNTGERFEGTEIDRRTRDVLKRTKSSTGYKNKYLKYKTKYFVLKKLFNV